MFEPIKVSRGDYRIPTSYVRCAAFKYNPLDEAFDRMKAEEGVRTSVIEADHFCALTSPDKTT